MKEQPIKIKDRAQRKLALTPLGHQAVKWIKASWPDDGNFTPFCPGCLRPVSKCSCPMEDR